MLIFKAQYLAMTLMHPVLCLYLWWKKGNTDWVQAEALKLIYCRACYIDDCDCYGKFGCYGDTNTLFLHAGPSMFNTGKDHRPIRCD